MNEFVCKILNAHSSKITDLIILKYRIFFFKTNYYEELLRICFIFQSLHLVTSSEDGSIRIWEFKESFYSTRGNNNE